MSRPALVPPFDQAEFARGPVLHDIAVQVVFSCPCSRRRALVIRQVHDIATCAGCQRQYVIVRAAFDPEQQPPLTVGIAMREPTILTPRVEVSAS